MARVTKATQRKAAAAEKSALKQGKGKDSFQNFALNLGVGTDNALSGSTYGFNPITRNRTLLEWIHRGSWLGGIAVDLVADDMTRAGIEIHADSKPEVIDDVQQTLVRTGSWNAINEVAKWSRLYGGCIGVIMIDGQDPSTPLEPDKVGKGSYKGIQPLDRWMVEPSLNDLVTDYGPYIGLPKFYRATSDAPGFKFKTIHYTRCIRLEGVKLPYWQRVSENLWGISILERLYDRMIAFDSATTGTAQLAYKSYLRTYKVKGMREIIAAGGEAQRVLEMYVKMMAMFQGVEGVTLLDSEDDFQANGSVNMSGMSDALLQFGQQISGALQIPLVRMFGQSPAGLNSSGESDLRTYYDGINQQQNKDLLVPMTTLVKVISLSQSKKLSDDFTISFRPLWQLSEAQKADIAARDTETVLSGEERGLVTPKTALKELRSQSKVTGRWTNISDEDIEAASDELAPKMDLSEEGDDKDLLPGGEKPPAPKKAKKEFASEDSLPISQLHGMDIVVESPRGTIRSGVNPFGGKWSVVMPADYGYIRRYPSAEGKTEWMDMFLGPDRDCADCWVIDGYEPNGKFDEHKIMLGFKDGNSALACYHEAYSDNRRAGGCTKMSVEDLCTWMASGDVTQPLLPRNLKLAAGTAV